MIKQWKCEDCVRKDTDACYFQNIVDGYKYCKNILVDADYAYQQGRIDAIADAIHSLANG